MKTFFIAFFTSVIVTLSISYLIQINLIDLSKFAKGETKVNDIEILMPNLNSLNLEEGKLVCGNLGLIVSSEELENENFYAGRIFKQFPLPGYKVKKGDAIRLSISIKPKKKVDNRIVMPDIVGQKFEEGKKILKDIGLKNISREDQFSESIKKGKIISVNPEINEKIEQLAKVQLFVSAGKAVKYTKVPNVLGKDYSRALNVINSAGLKLGKIFKITDEDKGFDRVVKQNYIPGKKVKVGTKINITLNVERGDL